MTNRAALLAVAISAAIGGPHSAAFTCLGIAAVNALCLVVVRIARGD